jgi:hypothetical protein
MQITLHAMIVFVGRRYIFVLRSKGKNTEPGSRENSVRNFICDLKQYQRDAQINFVLTIILTRSRRNS